MYYPVERRDPDGNMQWNDCVAVMRIAKINHNVREVFRTRQGNIRRLIVTAVADVPGDRTGFCNYVVMRFSDSDCHITLNADEALRLAQWLLDAT